MFSEQIREEKKNDRETYARITVPTHVSFNHFRKHVKVEGYYENRDVPDFMGCDRLLKLDHLYGTVQLGYNPRKNQPFLFANIKTSIFDTAASRYKKELKEYQMMRSLKTGNENILYSSRRWTDTAVILYKAEAKPWTEASIKPYLMRVNQGALRKTMPFLSREEETQRLAQSKEDYYDLGKSIQENISSGKFDELADLRSQQMDAYREQEWLQSVLTRKSQQSRLFFRKLNYSMDIQKHEMFAYYKQIRDKLHEREEVPPEEPPKNPTDSNNVEENLYE